eukprot:15482374-Alexandrium_andersonii.AAC.1
MTWYRGRPGILKSGPGGHGRRGARGQCSGTGAGDARRSLPPVGFAAHGFRRQDQPLERPRELGDRTPPGGGAGRPRHHPHLQD